MAKTKAFIVRFTPEEYKKLKKLSKENKLSMNKIVRTFVAINL